MSQENEKSSISRLSFLKGVGDVAASGAFGLLGGTNALTQMLQSFNFQRVNFNDPMKITRVESVRFSDKIKIGGGSGGDGGADFFCWVRLHTNKGIIGTGETYPNINGELGALIDTGYLLRTSDDSSGDVLGNKQDNAKLAKYFGMEKAYDFMYKHHRMDAIQIQDLKGRLIFLFRLLKVDTVMCYDPWEHYEENPDHLLTAHAVEAARWMAGSRNDYPEHFDAGLKPYSPKERYYFSRDPQRVNRVVDISNYIDKKVEACMINITKGPAGQGAGSKLKDRLARDGKKLPILGDDDNTADFNYVKHFVLDIDSWRLNFGEHSNKKIGEKYGLEWGEWYSLLNSKLPNKLEEYIQANAVSL